MARDPLTSARALAFYYGAEDRKSKPADFGHVWCAECGMRQVSEDVGDLCPFCVARLNRKDAH